jgi:hypothetical protein
MSYTDIFNNNPNGFSMGMPTVNSGAAIAGAGNTGVSTGITAPIATPTAPTITPPSGSVAGGTGGADAGKTGGTGFFSQYGPAQFALGAIQTLGSLWSSFQQNKLAKQTFNFQKEAYSTNLANQEKTYNTQLEDRINARYATEGRTNASTEAAAYVDSHKL